MKIYHYSPETRLYLDNSVANESPLEPGVYLVPAYATSVAPPHVDNSKQAFWRDDRWEVSGIPVTNPEIKPQENNNPLITSTWDTTRIHRNTLLAYSDRTQLPDAPLTKEQRLTWKTYRQALRDIPEIFSNPASVVWPEPPTSLNERQ